MITFSVASEQPGHTEGTDVETIAASAAFAVALPCLYFATNLALLAIFGPGELFKGKP